MKIVILIALLLAAGQASASPVEQVISVQHDSDRGVTCWIVNNTGISCLPDSSLPQTRASESEAARASLAGPSRQIEQFSTTSLPQEERLQL